MVQDQQAGMCRRRRLGVPIALLAVVSLAAACSSDSLPAAEPLDDTVESPTSDEPAATTGAATDDDPSGTEPDQTAAEPEATDQALRTDFAVLVDGEITTIDDRLFGTNVPAWLGPERLQADWFVSALERSGATTIRMPGGSWSSEYDWLACETGGDDCYWPWAARPSDYARLLGETGMAGMWTVSINDTAQSAAALVAFFNGEVGDGRVIGVDRDGVDWGTVSRWAELRAAAGFAEPIGVEYWEIGNEVWGGHPDAGGELCASFGWEQVWTCDGTEYVVGTADHDGYLDIRAAMVDVDPEISIGLVGVPDPTAWTDWGAKVITAAEDAFDFYVVHEYGFGETPGADAAARRPAELWPVVVDVARASLPDDIPIALTEFNLVSFEAADTGQAMTRAMNAIFIGESLGQLAESGLEMANHWNFGNGVTSSGSDYGLVNIDTQEPYPAFYAFEAWSTAGRELFDVVVGPDAGANRLYSTRRDDGTYLLIVLRADEGNDTVTISMGDLSIESARGLSHGAESAEATVLEPSEPAVTVDGATLTVDLPAWSVTQVEVVPVG